jgi:hypothetical protein
VADRDQLIEDYRQFTREMLARFDRGQREAAREWRANHREEMRHLDEISRRTDEISRRTDEISRRTDEIIAENRAQRSALLAILDELRGNGGPATA